MKFTVFCIPQAIGLFLSFSVFAQEDPGANWPQAAGPNHNWTVTTQQSVTLKWSAERNENIRWRTTLPESGQSGIAVWADRLFLTTTTVLMC